MAIGAAIGSVVGGIASASASSKAADASADAAKDAAKAQLQAARESNELQRDMFNTNLGLYQPQWESGLANQAALNYALGTGARPDTLTYNYPNQLTEDGEADTIEYVPGGSGGGTPPTTPLASIIMQMGRLSGAEPKPFNSSGGSGSGEPGYYTVGDKTFSTRTDAQAYLDSLNAENAFTPTYDGYAPMKDYFADLKDIDNFRASPDYEFRKSEGIDAMNANAAASGQRLSGNQIRAIGDYSSNLADNEYSDYYNRGASEYYNWMGGLQGQSATLPTTTNALAGAGQNYAGSVGNNNMNAAAGAANAYQNAGAAKASGYEGMASAFNGTMNNLASVYTMNQLGMFG